MASNEERDAVNVRNIDSEVYIWACLELPFSAGSIHLKIFDLLVKFIYLADVDGEDIRMNSLLVKADVIQHTSLPKSLRPTSPLPGNLPKHKHIKDLKLRTKLDRQAAHAARSKALVDDADLLLTGEAGKMQVENEMERTWRIGQDDIVQGAGQEAAKGRRELKLDGGPYRSRYSRNGRHLAIVGSMGHVATFDWQTGTMHAELQLQETCRDITYVPCLLHVAGFNISLKIFAGSVILCGCTEKICVHIRSRWRRATPIEITHRTYST